MHFYIDIFEFAIELIITQFQDPEFIDIVKFMKMKISIIYNSFTFITI